jgi:hypothetical protein
MTADGNWNLVVSTPMGERHGSLSLTTEGTTVKGSQMADGNSTEIFDGTVNGNEVFLESFDHRSNADDSRVRRTGQRGRNFRHGETGRV